MTQRFLEKIPYRGQIKKRISDRMDHERISPPFREGDYLYYFKNNGLQDQSVVYRQKQGGEPEIFLDPNTCSDDGSVSLDDLSFSRDGNKIAYSISEGGSDWRKVFIIDVESRKELESALQNIKFSALSWYKNEGIYYSSYDKPEGSELTERTEQHKLYFHRLGERQSSDVLIYGGEPEEKSRYVSGGVTEDDRYLIISSAESTTGNSLYIKELSRSDQPVLTIQSDRDADTYFVDNTGSQLYLQTNGGAPNNRLVMVDAGNPEPENWRDIIPETEHALSVASGGGYFYAEYLMDALTRIFQYSYDGKQLREIKLPDQGTASLPSGKKTDQTLYYSFTNYRLPISIFAFDVKQGDYSLYWQSGI